ncbi:putative calmodulin-like protein 2 [Curcuma longa]|uniref:putative calmodulin-like protein 2 n=1 Tax=Curcuma longa TaxID=136217 RepID=UPI003D9E9F46
MAERHGNDNGNCGGCGCRAQKNDIEIVLLVGPFDEIDVSDKRKSAREASRKLAASRHALPSFLSSGESMAETGKRKRRAEKATSASTMKLSVPSFLGSHSKKGSKNSSSRRCSAAGSSDGDSSSLLRSTLLPSFSARELEAALRRLGPVDPASGVDLTEAELAALLAEPSRPEAERELREAFAVFDADGDGKISAEELRSVLATLGDEACSLEDCRLMIHGVDTDGDGFVCFNDFARMMDGQRCF